MYVENRARPGALERIGSEDGECQFVLAIAAPSYPQRLDRDDSQCMDDEASTVQSLVPQGRKFEFW